MNYRQLTVTLLILIVLIIEKANSANFPKVCPRPIKACFLGLYMKSSDKTVKYENYLGIPYAKPPIGELRYMRPVEHEYANTCTAYLTLTERPACAHYAFQHQYEPYGNEDCLYLNVYKPILKPNASSSLVSEFLNFEKTEKANF